MVSKVQVLPSGHEFDAQPGESILQAGLRAGLNLRYNCSNGACGECRAKLLSGELKDCRPSDFTFGEAQRLQGFVLMCSTTPATDCVIEVNEAGGAEDIPHQLVAAKVVKLQQLNEDYMIVGLRTPRSKLLHFLAGQHVILHIHGLPPRRKALANCPCDGTRPQFHFRRHPGDPLSDHVFSQLKVSAQWDLEGPNGNFALREDSHRPIVFIAYETGFASINSVIEHVLALEMEQAIYLYWISADPKGQYLANYCRSLQDALDNFSYQAITLTARGIDALERAVGDILTVLPHPQGCDFYMALPEVARSRIQACLTAAGVAEDMLKFDVLVPL